MAWALDLGTSNTGVARWDGEADAPRLVELPGICRAPGRVEPLEAPRLVPTATQVVSVEDFWGRLGRWPPLQRRVFWGRHAHIGRDALERNAGWPQASYAPSFKGWLARDPTRTLARLRGAPLSARDIARAFLRELLAEITRVTGERPRDLVVTTPVESFDSYRAEIRHLARSLGVSRLRFCDEPVAAALGYGLGVGQPRKVLVVDFGGGTLDLAVVGLHPRAAESGTAEVLAKAGRPLGGRDVDAWTLTWLAGRLDISLAPGESTGEAAMWRRLMKAEARRVKEALHFAPTATFEVVPPDEAPGVRARLGSRPRYADVDRGAFRALLTERGLYAALSDCADEVVAQLRGRGHGVDEIDDVLMVGGSTLLPGVFHLFEERFGRDRVRAWQPFEAVAYGACAFAADRAVQSDFIVHDYAILTHERQPDGVTRPRHVVVVPRGTRFPTAPDLWKRRMVPTCAMGEPERVFKLVVCELAGGGDRRFTWDREGHLHQVGGDETAEPLVVPLNEKDPTLGRLDPPHPFGDTTARLEVAFGVDANRWLIATVDDLKTGKRLMDKAAVARLL